MVDLWIRSSLPQAPGVYHIPLQRGGLLQPPVLVPSDQEVDQILQAGHNLLKSLPCPKTPLTVPMSSGEEMDVDSSGDEETSHHKNSELLVVDSLLTN